MVSLLMFFVVDGNFNIIVVINKGVAVVGNIIAVVCGGSDGYYCCFGQGVIADVVIVDVLTIIVITVNCYNRNI